MNLKYIKDYKATYSVSQSAWLENITSKMVYINITEQITTYEHSNNTTNSSATNNFDVLFELMIMFYTILIFCAIIYVFYFLNKKNRERMEYNGELDYNERREENS